MEVEQYLEVSDASLSDDGKLRRGNRSHFIFLHYHSWVHFEQLFVFLRNHMDMCSAHHHRSDRLRRAVPGMEHGSVGLDRRPFDHAFLRLRHRHLRLLAIGLLQVATSADRNQKPHLHGCRQGHLRYAALLLHSSSVT
ncbi:hypothetical protein HPP92_022552 [Vanilla planifolia]|uniref:Uncharacterized protein n=1 Tax=Vanilla planifolia TaxID=51239 RepID=A0A835PTH2_VANPL|nr:hypothetical protein HPP92_022552 [Vanilla planifolia]